MKHNVCDPIKVIANLVRTLDLFIPTQVLAVKGGSTILNDDRRLANDTKTFNGDSEFQYRLLVVKCYRHIGSNFPEIRFVIPFTKP